MNPFHRSPRIVLFTAALLLGIPHLRAADAIVAADGSGTFKTVQEAVDAAPLAENTSKLFLIAIKPGTYKENLTIPKNKAAIELKGEDAARTTITFDHCAASLDAQGKPIGTGGGASVFIFADNFTAENLTFENSFGPGSQAVAVQVAADRAIFRKCRFLGYQDTLLLKSGRSFFNGCYLAGAVDFIFGAGLSWFENCELHCLGGGFITAASTSSEHPYGYVFSHCRITTEGEGWKTFLGRPWGPAASVTFMETEMPAAIQPAGWHNWDKVENEATTRYAEIGSTGPGGDSSARAPWSHQLTPLEASTITKQHVLAGWNPDLAMSPERIAALPEPTRKAWEDYLERSATHMKHDQDVLNKEVQAAALPKPLAAPAAPDFKLESHLPMGWFASAEARKLADTILSYQIPSGGWSKHIDFAKGPRQPGMEWSSQVDPLVSWHYVGTFDNRSTTEELRLLAGVFQATGRTDVKAAFLKGLDYIFEAQFPNGGWPQVYPLEGGYHDDVTFNDDAMVHVLMLLQEIANHSPDFQFVDSARRAHAATAQAAGVRCILQCQVVQNGRKTAWCAQHEPLTLAIAPARYIEPASLSGGESLGIINFLKAQPNPSPEILGAIKDGIAWFDRSRITNLRAVQNGKSTSYIIDPSSNEVYWARFNDAVTNRPIFPGGQDGRIYDSFAAMAEKNRVGYEFFLTKPAELFGKNPSKKKKITTSAKEKAFPKP